MVIPTGYNIQPEPLDVNTADFLFWCQLRDFIESKDVDGVVSTTATDDQAKQLSEKLLHKAVEEVIKSGRLGLFEAAVTCVASRCRSVNVDQEVGRIGFPLKNHFVCGC